MLRYAPLGLGGGAVLVLLAERSAIGAYLGADFAEVDTTPTYR